MQIDQIEGIFERSFGFQELAGLGELALVDLASVGQGDSLADPTSVGSASVGQGDPLADSASVGQALAGQDDLA